MVFSWGDRGGEEETPGTTESFSQDDSSFPNNPFCGYILYIEEWRFRYSIRQTIVNGPRSSSPWSVIRVVDPGSETTVDIRPRDFVMNH